jgi:tetratricopeptide (TPR) repeat protein
MIKGVVTGPDDAPELFDSAYAAYARRDLAAALAGFHAVLEAHPDERDEIDALFEIGKVWTDLEDYRQARVAYGRTAEALSRAIDRKPSDPELARHFNDRGVARALTGELESSLKDFGEAVRLAHGSYPRASKSTGRVLLALRRFAEAGEAYRTAIDQLPEDGGAHYGLARVLAVEDRAEAVAEAREAVALMEGAGPAGPDHGSAGRYLFFAWVLRAWGGDETERRSALAAAIRICERNIEDRRDRPLSTYLLAHAELEQERYAAAAGGFAAALDLLTGAGAGPDVLYAAHAGRGRALALAGRFDEALGACQQAVALAAPGELRENSLVDLAYVLRRRGQVEEAVLVIEEARDSARRAGRLPRPGERTVAPGGYRSWGILATEAMIRIALAEKYRDSSSWSDAVGAFEQAVRAAGGRVRPAGKGAYDQVSGPAPRRRADGRVRLDEEIAYGALLTAGGYARWQLGDLAGAALAFGDAKAALPADSVDYFTAESAERRVRAARSFRLPPRLPHVTTAAVAVMIAAATVLEAYRRLGGAAWASVVLGLALLAVASWCLPVIRTLKIGGAEFTKEVGYREEAQVVRLSAAPLTAGLPPEDSLRDTTPQPATPEPVPVHDVPYAVPGPEAMTVEPEVVAPALREAIALGKGAPEGADAVHDALRRSSVYALGETAGVVKDGTGTESELLHFAIDSEVPGVDKVMLPVFTAAEPMRNALLRNPDWQTLSVLEVNGAALTENIDPEVHIVIDPWADGEFQLPSRDETGPAGGPPAVAGEPPGDIPPDVPPAGHF